MPSFKTRKNRNQRGGVNSNIAKLLSKNTSVNSTSTLNSIKRVMKGYIASPWNAIDKNIMNTSEYGQVLNEYKKINQTVNKKSALQRS